MKRQTPLLEVNLICGLVSENQDLTCVRVCLYPLSVLLNYQSSEWKTGSPRALVLWKSLCCAGACPTRTVGPGLLIFPGQSWVPQGQRKGQKSLLRSKDSEKGYRAGDGGKEEGKQEEQKNGRPCGGKAEQREEMERDEKEGKWGYEKSRSEIGLHCEETSIPAVTGFESTMERLEQKGFLSHLDFWLGLICVPKGPSVVGEKSFSAADGEGSGHQVIPSSASAAKSSHPDQSLVWLLCYNVGQGRSSRPWGSHSLL